MKHHTIVDPHAETIGLSSLTIKLPEDFRGYAEICWRPIGKGADEDKRQIACSVTALLQGAFCHASAPRPGGLFDARVVALVLHAFYRSRIEAAMNLEAAYEWQPYAIDDLSLPQKSLAVEIADAKRSLGAVMEVAWKAHQENRLSETDYREVTSTAVKLRLAFQEWGTK